MNTVHLWGGRDSGTLCAMSHRPDDHWRCYKCGGAASMKRRKPGTAMPLAPFTTAQPAPGEVEHFQDPLTALRGLVEAIRHSPEPVVVPIRWVTVGELREEFR